MKTWVARNRDGKEVGRILAHSEAEAARRAKYCWPKQDVTLTEVKANG